MNIELNVPDISVERLYSKVDKERILNLPPKDFTEFLEEFDLGNTNYTRDEYDRIISQRLEKENPELFKELLIARDSLFFIEKTW